MRDDCKGMHTFDPFLEKEFMKAFSNSLRNGDNHEYRSIQECLAFENVNSCAAKILTKSHIQSGNRQRTEAIKLILLRIPSFHKDWGMVGTSLVGK
jgi:hypothetical protein